MKTQNILAKYREVIPDRAQQRSVAAALRGRYGLLPAKISRGQILLRRKCLPGGSDGRRRAVYITFFLATEHACHLGSGGGRRHRAPEKKDQNIEQTYFLLVRFLQHVTPVMDLACAGQQYVYLPGGLSLVS